MQDMHDSLAVHRHDPEGDRSREAPSKKQLDFKPAGSTHQFAGATAGRTAGDRFNTTTLKHRMRTKKKYALQRMPPPHRNPRLPRHFLIKSIKYLNIRNVN